LKWRAQHVGVVKVSDGNIDNSMGRSCHEGRRKAERIATIWGDEGTCQSLADFKSQAYTSYEFLVSFLISVTHINRVFSKFLSVYI
ncbi:unnamed protein product, partial [Thlaspi arvense]